jgi:cytochrome c-type biogenesis protein
VGQLLLSTTILASFLGGVVALLAPCCVSVMLPAYFASTFQRRSRIVGMTLVFAAGVGTVILPVALGASALSRVVSGQHALVFSIGGAAMIIGGFAMLAGWTFSLPMLSLPARTDGGFGSVYSLGVFPARPAPAVPRSSPASRRCRVRHRPSQLPSPSGSPTCSAWSRR